MLENKKQNDRKLDYDPKENDRVIYDLSKLPENDQELISQYIGKNVIVEDLFRERTVVKITGFHCITPNEIKMTFDDFIYITGFVSIGNPLDGTWVETTDEEAQDASKKLNPDDLEQKIKNDFTDAGLLLDMLRKKTPNGIHMILVDKYGSIINYASANNKGRCHIKRDVESSNLIVFNDAKQKELEKDSTIVNLTEKLQKLSGNIQNENKVVLETPAGKHVPLELLERALTLLYNAEQENDISTPDFLVSIKESYSNEFPELSFQIVGDKVVVL